MNDKVKAVIEEIEECRFELLFDADEQGMSERQEQHFLMGISLLDASVRSIKLSLVED